MVSDAAATKAPIARIADRVSAVFVPTVIGVSLFTLAIWLLAGRSFAFAIARAIAVLVMPEKNSFISLLSFSVTSFMIFSTGDTSFLWLMFGGAYI